MNQISKFIISFLFVVLLFTSCKKIAAGSYPYAEFYTLNIYKEELIDQVEKFKTEYTQYRVIEIQSDGSLREDKDHYFRKFYITYFYLPDYDLVMRCVISKNKDNLGEIGLYAIYSTSLGSRSINTSDFARKENKYYKKLFEEEVLAPLKEFIAKE